MTYDRHNIRKWLLLGGSTCPLTGVKLISRKVHMFNAHATCIDVCHHAPTNPVPESRAWHIRDGAGMLWWSHKSYSAHKSQPEAALPTSR